MLALTLILDVGALLVNIVVLKLILFALSAIVISFTLYFFRDPLRRLPENIKSNQLVSPADGKVMLIEEIDEPEFMKARAKLIGIFMSPLNVHVNRIPVTGKVEYIKHFDGEYIAAYQPDSAARNERTLIGISSEGFRILFKQIAGLVARRIVCELKEGDSVRKGETFGMIKFGSRVDVIVPENSVISVSVNQKVVCGETIIAEVAGA